MRAQVMLAGLAAVLAAVAWLAAHWLVDALAGWLAVMGVFGLVHKARSRGRRGLPNGARPVSQVPRSPRAPSEPLRVPRSRQGR